MPKRTSEFLLLLTVAFATSCGSGEVVGSASVEVEGVALDPEVEAHLGHLTGTDLDLCIWSSSAIDGDRRFALRLVEDITVGTHTYAVVDPTDTTTFNDYSAGFRADYSSGSTGYSLNRGTVEVTRGEDSITATYALTMGVVDQVTVTGMATFEGLSRATRPSGCP